MPKKTASNKNPKLENCSRAAMRRRTNFHRNIRAHLSRPKAGPVNAPLSYFDFTSLSMVYSHDLPILEPLS